MSPGDVKYTSGEALMWLEYQDQIVISAILSVIRHDRGHGERMIIKQRDTRNPDKDMLPGLPPHAGWYSDFYPAVREGREVCLVALEEARTKPVGPPNEPVR